jgi:predicted dehydrogenase
MTKPIRIGFIGAGNNSRRKHIPLFQEQDGVCVHGVVNRSRASSDQVARQFGIQRVYESWGDLIADPDIDAVCIGTWPNMHCSLTLAALAAGKHVLCEARMAMDAAEAHRMLEASRARPDLITQIVPSPIMLGGPDQAIYDAIQGGRVGAIVAVDVISDPHGYPDPSAPMTWRQDIESSGVNAMGLGIVYEALMRWVGHARTVCAVTRINVPVRTDHTNRVRPIRVPDHVEVIGELENGASYRIQCSQVIGHGPEGGIWIHGTDGTLRIHRNRVLLYVKGGNEVQDITTPPGTWGGWRVELEFIGAIRGSERVRFTTFEDGVRYMEFTDAVVDSHVRGQRMEL